MQVSARAIGLTTVALSFLSLSIPGVVTLTTLLSVLPFYLLLTACLIGVGVNRSLYWVIPGMIAGLGVIVIVQLPFGQTENVTAATSVVAVAGGAVSAFALVLIGSRARMAVLGTGIISTTALTQWASAGDGLISSQAGVVFLGWCLTTTFAYWLSASMPRAARRIFSIGRAHRAEREASENDAQRRQSARLLHDTVLATLTLLAHSGVGVSASALQYQAKEDAELLRQLRLGLVPVLQSVEQVNLEPVQESTLGHTLQSVKSRFSRMGLEVSWHGTGQVLLPSEVLDAFLLALAECLENVRRHSGVSDAHVTITDDESTVRAMVTDAGVGFVLEDVDSARLGFTESVVGRLREVGGSARLFSSLGAGTTVVLEVPR